MTNVLVVDAARNMPNWKRLNRDNFLYIKCLSVIEKYLDTQAPLSQRKLAKEIGVSEQDADRLYQQYPELPRVVAAYERNRRRRRYRTHPTFVEILNSYKKAYRSLFEQYGRVTGVRLAAAVGVTPKSARMYISRHPEVKLITAQ